MEGTYSPHMNDEEFDIVYEKLKKVEDLILNSLKKYKIDTPKSINIDMMKPPFAELDIDFHQNYLYFSINLNNFTITKIRYEMSNSIIDETEYKTAVSQIMSIAMIIHKDIIKSDIINNFKTIFKGGDDDNHIDNNTNHIISN